MKKTMTNKRRNRKTLERRRKKKTLFKSLYQFTRKNSLVLTINNFDFQKCHAKISKTVGQTDDGESTMRKEEEEEEDYGEPRKYNGVVNDDDDDDNVKCRNYVKERENVFVCGCEDINHEGKIAVTVAQEQDKKRENQTNDVKLLNDVNMNEDMDRNDDDDDDDDNYDDDNDDDDDDDDDMFGYYTLLFRIFPIFTSF